MKEIETLCKLRKKKHHYPGMREDIVETVKHPKYICEKCLRVASKEELLCSPCAIDKWRP
ncbi:MAG TPA: hypothetical protein VMH22_08170 [bacterium]|nr:hypothetical protein [bacterium]